MNDDLVLTALLRCPSAVLVGAALDGTVTRWSAGAERLYGWSANQILGRQVSMLVPDDRREELARRDLVLSGEQVPTFETVRLTRDESLIEIDLDLFVVRGEDDRPVGTLALHHDLRRAVRAEAALSTSERELHSRFADSPVPQSRVDLQGRLLAVNPAMEKLLGEPVEDLIGRNVLAWHRESERAGRRAELARLVSGGEDYVRGEHTLVRADGEQLCTVITVTAVRDRDGATVLAGSVQDMTALRSSEQRVRAEAARMEALLRSMPFTVFSYDRAGRCTSSRGRALKHFGMAEDELVGVCLLERYAHPSAIHDALLASLAGERVRVVVDLADRVWDCHYQPMYDHDGELIGGLGVAVDISERAAAEREVQANEARLRALLRYADDVVLVIDRGGRLLYVCPAVDRVFGYDDHALFGRQVSAFHHPDDRPIVANAWRRVVQAADASHTFTCRVRHADGAWRWCENVVTNLMENPDVAGFVLNVRDITERRKAEAELRHLALHDDLTGLPNRTLLLDRIQHALGWSKRAETHTGLILLNVAGMAAVNEAVGQDGGNVVLRMIADRLLGAVRETDSVARVGGDDFAVLVEDVSSVEELRARASTLVGAVSGPITVGGTALNLALRAGSALTPAADVGSLLAAAERALLTSGTAHRTLVVTHAARDGDADSSRARAAYLELQRGIALGELRLHYQPVMHLLGEAVSGVEALVRWQHPERGLLAPTEFIPLAESSGLIVELGKWVLREACTRAAAWQEAGQTFGVGVNLSPRQMVGADVVDLVRDVLAETGARPDRLVLEVTESAVMDEPQAPDILRALRAMGVRLALDDFGTGYSSLTYLRRFPLDAIKIDRSFVSGLGRDADDEAIVGSVVSLSRAIGKLVVAEGVETVVQLNALRALGVDQAQGFLWSPALPADELVAWLDVRRDSRADRIGTEVPVAVQRVGAAATDVLPTGSDQARMLELHGEGASLHTIAAALNAEGRRTPTGPRWTTTTVARVVGPLVSPFPTDPSG